VTEIESITVIAPMRNEEAHIDSFVDGLAAQDFEGSLQVLVADGASTDDSVAILERAAARTGLDVTVIPNPARWASGDLIVRLDCHSSYPPDYLRKCAIAAAETGAENVGGIFVPVGRTTMERAVACAMSSPFGGIHWTRDNGSTERVEADTVPYGAFRPSAFVLAGQFDESLVRDQDDEFNLRLRLRGGRIVLDPGIRVYYTPRGSLRAVFKQYYEYGFWKPRVMLKHRQVVSARSMVPVAFVASLAVLVPAAAAWPPARLLLAAELALYGGCALAFGAVTVARRREWTLLPRVVAVFPAFHCGHGAGMLAGWLRAGLRR
jgi:glycosyltransferase involved in cell wall biosynthesis